MHIRENLECELKAFDGHSVAFQNLVDSDVVFAPGLIEQVNFFRDASRQSLGRLHLDWLSFPKLLRQWA